MSSQRDVWKPPKILKWFQKKMWTETTQKIVENVQFAKLKMSPFKTLTLTLELSYCG